jgi:hypothetical protein
MRASQTRHSRAAEAEGTAAIALVVVLDKEVGQDCWSRLHGERLDVGGAEFGRYAVVGEEEGESVPGAGVFETADVLICGGGSGCCRAG